MDTAYRPQQILIDVVKPDALPIISIVVQELQLTGGQISAITADSLRIYKKAADVAHQTVELTDPITGLSGLVSIAGIESMLRKISNQWIAENLNLEIDTQTGWAIK